MVHRFFAELIFAPLFAPLRFCPPDGRVIDVLAASQVAIHDIAITGGESVYLIDKVLLFRHI